MDIAAFFFLGGLFLLTLGRPIIEANRRTYEALNGPLDVAKFHKIWVIGGVVFMLIGVVQAAGSCAGVDVVSF